jgi:glycosyltransferase involved in cell wall biosynthesis
MILYLGNKLSVHGYTPTSVETLGKKIEELGFRIVTKSSVHNQFLRLADMIWSIIKYRKHRPLVIIDTYSTSAFWFAWISARLCNYFDLKYIPILHGGELPVRLDKSPRISNEMFRSSYTNIAVSNYLSSEFIKRNLHVQTIHNYLELEKYPVKIRHEVNPRLLWVRSFHKIYNPHLALLVLKKLSQQFPEATLCMVGPDKDGSLDECKKLVEIEMLNVTFKGRLNKDEWIQLSKEYDIFINTTNVDNTPVSVMEAMALGMPVVTTNAGGIPYLFKDGEEGLMVDTNNENKMVEAICRLINNPALANKLSCSSRSKAAQWDWKVIGKEWKTLLDAAHNKPSS